MSLNLSGQDGSPTLSVNDQPNYAAVEHTRHMHSGANWFFWIAGLSLINSVIALVKGGWSFLAGLGVTQVIDGLALGLSDELGGAAVAVALVLDLVVAGFFVGLGLYARRALLWAFVLGMIVYALDGVLLAAFQVWLSLAFHAFALYGIYRGYAAARKLKGLAASTPGGA
jgi:zinc transporter ZupT